MRELLMTVQLYCRRAIVTEDAFPDSTEFEYSMEKTFSDQARLFIERRCACLAVLFISDNDEHCGK